MVTLFQCYIRQWRPSTLEIPTYPMIRLLGFIGSSRKTLPSFMHVLHAKWRRPYDVAWKQGASNAGMPANLLLTDSQLEYMVIIWSFVLPHFSAYLRHWPSLIGIHWSMLKLGDWNCWIGEQLETERKLHGPPWSPNHHFWKHLSNWTSWCVPSSYLFRLPLNL